ncbi:MAG: nuclear transport factor 2 family protein [Proteobacteria bacterium]|nr:MAG: nuclear transport factor 2 family protein [Pseudomonadota bacterium]
MGFSSENFLAKFYEAIDSREASRFSEFFAEDGEFIFGNFPPSKGHAAIEKSAQGVFDAIDGISHRLKSHSIDSSGRLLMEGIVRYVKKNGAIVELPYACGMTLDSVFKQGMVQNSQPKVKSYQAYVDIAPLWKDS